MLQPFRNILLWTLFQVQIFIACAWRNIKLMSFDVNIFMVRPFLYLTYRCLSSFTIFLLNKQAYKEFTDTGLWWTKDAGEIIWPLCYPRPAYPISLLIINMCEFIGLKNSKGFQQVKIRAPVSGQPPYCLNKSSFLPLQENFSLKKFHKYLTF